jgi:hypothetical protein
VVLGEIATRYGKSKHKYPVDRRRPKLRVKSKPRITLADEKIEIPHSTTFSAEALAYGLSVYANNMRAGIKAAYGEMSSLAGQKQWVLGDYSSFTRIVKKVPDIICTRIYRGRTGFELACVPRSSGNGRRYQYNRSSAATKRYSSYEVHDAALGQINLPNGYFWMDCSSRMITGVWLESDTTTAIPSATALREALRLRYPGRDLHGLGRPEGAKQSPHISRACQAKHRPWISSRRPSVFGDMPYERRGAPPRPSWRAVAKPIENIMNILDTMMDARFIGGYRKRNMTHGSTSKSRRL